MKSSGTTAVIAGSGEMADRIRHHNWAATALGPLEGWPVSLKTLVGMMIAAPSPMVLLWGPSGVLIYNDGYARFAGDRHPNLLGRSHAEAWPEIAAFNNENMRRAMTGESWSLRDQELALRRHGAGLEPAWMDLDYTPVPDDSGEPGGLMVFVTETTDRLQARRREAETHQQLDMALSAGRGVGTWDWDVLSDRVVADERFAKIYGVDAEMAAAGAPLEEFFRAIHPGDSARVQGEIALALSTGNLFQSEYRLIGAGGDVRWVAAEGRALRGDDGISRRFPGVTFDITDRHKAERRRRVLLDLNDAIRDVTDTAEIAHASSRILAEALEVSRVGYGVMDTVAETVTIERDWNAPGIDSIAGVIHFRDFGSYIENLARGEVVVFDNAGQDPRISDGGAALDGISARGLINLPLMEQGRVVALLFVNNATPRHWSDGDVALVREVAERVRTAAERARATEALRDNEARLRFLDDLNVEVARLTDANAILECTTRMTARHLGVTNCAYADMDADQDGFTIRDDWAAPGTPSIVGHYRLADFGALAVQELGAARPLIINDNRKEIAPQEAATFQAIASRRPSACRWSRPGG